MSFPQVVKWGDRTHLEYVSYKKRSRSGPSLIGLYRAKKEGNERWPPQVIRDLFEELRSGDIELGLIKSGYNARALPGGILLSLVNEGGSSWSVISLRPAHKVQLRGIPSQEC